MLLLKRSLMPRKETAQQNKQSDFNSDSKQEMMYLPKGEFEMPLSLPEHMER